MVVFRRLNLLTGSLRFNEPIDAVFCRNVLIYFNHDDQRRILDRIVAELDTGSLLFLGPAEGLMLPRHRLAHLEGNVYRVN